MQAETIAALVRTHKQIMRCEEHLAGIHRRLQSTSCALANSLRMIEGHGPQGAFSGHRTMPSRKPGQADRLVTDVSALRLR